MDVILRQEIIEILSDDSKNDWLFEYANETRKNFVGDEVHLRGLIEFSNICKQQCKYCGLQSTNKNIERYRILKDEILYYVENAVKLGYKTVVLQSGEDEFYSVDKMCEIIKEIKKFDVALTLSVGEKSYDEYKEYKKSGADRYLLRIETTDEKLYSNLHPNMSPDNRKQCLYNIKKLGFETGTGSLIGLPNQTIESIADDILFFKELNADMVGVGPFIAHPDTPLKNEKNGSFLLALRTMALVRIMLPDINIPATTAMETLNPNGRIIALNSGANVVMPNVTKKEYRKKYEIYPNKICINEDGQKCTQCIKNKIKSINRTVSSGYGFRKNNS